MFDFNGADNVLVDGLNTGGDSLTISNLSTSASSGTSTIRFQTDATSNTITNATILGSATMAAGTNGGNILFGAAAVTTGNDNNTVSNCNLGPAGANIPSKIIHFGGSSNTDPGTANSGIIINNNNIFDYFSATVASTGIDLNSGTVGTTISNNRFYQTATRTQTTGTIHSAIRISNGSGNAYQITGNTIGFGAANGTGTYTLVGVAATKFYPITLVVGTTTATSVQGNTIAGMAMSGAAAGTSSTAPFIAIAMTSTSAGLVTIGDVTGNTIGSQSATGSITYTSSATTASDVIGAFNFGSSNWVTNNNTIGGITASNSSTGASNIYGLRVNTGSGQTWSCLNNTIGGTVANSINSTSTATGTIVNGLLNNNPIGTITGNIVRNMTVAGGTGTTTSASMAGIVMNNSANNTLSQNSIFNLSNTNTTAATVVTGLQFSGSGTANTVERTLIYGLTSSTTSATAEINGIRVGAGTTVYRNNMIALGAGVANAIGGATANGISGISEPAVGTDSFFHNSVYIGGSPTAGTGSSWAFNSTQTTNTRSFRDNIFFNARSNSGATGKNYAVRVGGTAANPAGLTINNNIYFANGTGAVFGFFNSLDVANLTAWKAAVGQDAASFESNPQYNDATNATPDLHLHPTNATVAEGGGVDVGVTLDYDGQTRSGLTPVDIGADAGNFTSAGDSTAPNISYTTLANTVSTANRTLSVTISDATAVDQTGGGGPRIYFRKGTSGAYSVTSCSNTGGTPQNGTYDCLIDYTLVTGGSVAVDDVIQYYVAAQDTLGNVSTNPGGGSGATPPGSTAPGSPNSYTILFQVSSYPYSQDFEGGAGRYTTAIVGGSVNDWVLGTPAKAQLSAAHSGTQAWITKTATDYSTSHNAAVVSPVFNFASLSGDPTLSFWQNFNVPSSEIDWDSMVLEISTNGGGAWTKVDSNVGTGGTFNTALSTGWYNLNGSSGPITGPEWTNSSTGYTGHSSGWIQSTTVLTGTAGQADVRLRWRFGSDSSGVGQGFAIDDIAITPPTPMSYVSSTSTQNPNPVALGGTSQHVIGLQVVTTGTTTPLSATSFTLNTNGTQDLSDISNAKLWYTGTSSTFAASGQFGSTVTTPTGSFNFTGSQTLATGTNYFWLTYDITSSPAALGRVVDAEFNSVDVGGSQTPTVTAPAGTNQILGLSTVPSGNTNTGSSRQPLATYYGYQRSADIYTAAELGIPTGSQISNMCWFVNSSSSPVNGPTKIYMKNVASSTFAAATTVATELTGATLLYDATPTLTYTASTWQCLNLSAPFAFNGTNLEIIVETNAGGTGIEGSTSKQFRYSTAANAHQFWEKDTTAPTEVSTALSSGGWNGNRPNIQFNYGAAAAEYSLTLTAPNGSIGGAPGPNGIVDTNKYLSGTSVTVTASPDAGYHFTGWSGACSGMGACVVTMDADKSVTANFAINTYTLTYTAGANGSISGTSPQTVNHGASGSAVTAVPDAGYHFVNWSDSSTSNPRTDTNVTGDITVTANFAINQYTLTYTAGANGSISGTSPQTVNHGANGSTVTAVPNVGYAFANWSDGYPTAARTDMNVTANITATANFAFSCTAPSTVYVDDSWVGTTIGTDPDGGGPAMQFGCDSFATIQGGVSGVASGGTVNVSDGSYVENVSITQPLTLTGAGAATVTLVPAVSDPNCGGGGGGSLCAGSSNLILVGASDVTISGMTLDGDNTSLPGGFNVGGANVDARNGIITNHIAGTFQNLTVHHTTVRNIYLRGVYASSGGSFNFHHNTVQNVQADGASIAMFNFGGAGVFDSNNVSAANDAISSNHSRGTQFTNNTVTDSASGIHTDNAGDGGGTFDTISGNSVTNSQTFGYGIWVFVPYKTVHVTNNTVTNVDVGTAVFGDSGVTTATKPGRTAVNNVPGRTAPRSVSVDEPGSPAQRGANRSNAPESVAFAATFTGNTIDGQNKANSTGVYFTTSQIGFGSGEPKVEFTSNTVINNVDGFYVEAETGFTLETSVSQNRIVGNTNSQVTQASGAGYTGTLNGGFENNWWGCNAGPNNAGCGVVTGAGVDFDPWIVLGTNAVPSSITEGGTSTVTADMTKNSVAGTPAGTLPNVAVSFSATEGTMAPPAGTVTAGTAVSTFTSTSPNNASACATVDGQQVCAAITVTPLATATNTATPSSTSTNTATPSATSTATYTPTPLTCSTPSTVYVDDSWVGTTMGTDPDGGGPAMQFGCDSFATIQGGVDGVLASGTVIVAAGTYVEDVNIPKTLSLMGAGIDVSTVSGPAGGPVSTIFVGAGSVLIDGFTVTREGNAVATWNDPLNSAGVAVQSQGNFAEIRNSKFTGNRTGIDINNSNGNFIHNNIIDFNRTGLIFRNQTDNTQFVENFVTNNWTAGVLFLDASGGTNTPPQQALTSAFNNNNISGNWYAQVVDRQSGGSLPAPGTNLKDFTGNWWGTTSPVVTTANSTEPGYAAQIPVAYGGTSTAPGGQPDIAGSASANIDYLPVLCSGTDTNVETTLGRGTIGFQGAACPTPTNTATSTSTNTATPTPTCVPISIPSGVQTLSGVVVTVPINTGDVTGHFVLSSDITVTYDPAVLSPLANPTFGVALGTVGNSNGGRALEANVSTPGILNISIYGPNEMVGGGVLVDLNFNVIGVPGTSSALNFTLFRYNEETPCTDETNGSVTVIPGSIAGTVNYANPATGPDPRGVPGVSISGAGSPAVSDTTGATGTYSLTGFGMGSYVVTPSKSGGVNGAITSFDCAKIAQFVTSNTSLTAAQLAAADVTGAGGVTSFDAAMIARYIASLGPPQGNTGSWLFTPSNRSYSTVYANYTGEDYTALLTGDVSGNWGDPSPYRPAMGPEKTASVAAPQLFTPADNEVIVPLALDAANERGIISYEFELRYDPAVIQPQVNPIEITKTLSGSMFTTVNAETPGLLRVVVYGAMPLEGSGVLMNLKFVGVGAAGSVSPLTWERLMLNEGTPRVSMVDGQITLTRAQPNQAEIAGRVLNSVGAGLANSRVTLIDSLGQSRSMFSDEAGSYRFGGLQVGQTYTVRVESRGFIFTPLTVSALGQSTNVDMIATQ